MAGVSHQCYWARPHAPTSIGEEDLIQNTTALAIDNAMPIEQGRGHLGMSQIGKKDARTLWFQFRWSLPEQPIPRVRRIFRVGHILESEVIALLRNVPDLTVHDRDPKSGGQFNFSFLGGHFSGSMDGCIIGIPEAPRTWHVLEIKTVSTKRFEELKKLGVEQWSAEYYVQMQCYMGASGMDRALFVAYNKDNSELYIERVKLDPMTLPAMIAKAERIITSDTPPESSYPKREWYEAKFMSEEAQSVYWGDVLPAPNCRNCRFAMARMDRGNGAWLCALKQEDLSLGSQRVGCASHNYLPALVNAELIDKGDGWTKYKTHDGLEFFNHHDNVPHVFSSKELFEMSKQGLTAEVLGDQVLNDIRDQFNGRVIA